MGMLRCSVCRTKLNHSACSARLTAPGKGQSLDSDGEVQCDKGQGEKQPLRGTCFTKNAPIHLS